MSGYLYSKLYLRSFFTQTKSRHIVWTWSKVA